MSNDSALCGESSSSLNIEIEVTNFENRLYTTNERSKKPNKKLTYMNEFLSHAVKCVYSLPVGIGDL
jgi:hypothetical protein